MADRINVTEIRMLEHIYRINYKNHAENTANKQDHKDTEAVAAVFCLFYLLTGNCQFFYDIDLN